MKIENIIEAKTRSEWREWLTKNHKRQFFCWVEIGGELSYLNAVEEALCFGWIDSTKVKGFQRFSPRTKKSNWTELNRERVRRLEKLGKMTEAGRVVVPTAEFEIRSEILEAINNCPETKKNFENLPELYKKIKIDNIQSQFGTETFNTRLQKFLENTKQNKLYGQWNDGGRLL